MSELHGNKRGAQRQRSGSGTERAERVTDRQTDCLCTVSVWFSVKHEETELYILYGALMYIFYGDVLLYFDERLEHNTSSKQGVSQRV